MHKSSRYIRSLFLISVVSSLTIGQTFAASYLSQVLPDGNTKVYSAPSVTGAGFSVPLFSHISPLSPSTFSLTSLTDSLASLVKQGPRIAKVSLLPLETYQSFALGGYSVQAQRAPSVTNANAASFLDRLSLTVFCSLAANKDASRCSYDTLLALRGTPDTTTVLGYPVEQTPVAVATSTPSTSQPSPRVVYVPQYITNYVTEYVLGTPGRDGKDGKDGTSSALVNNTSIPSGFGSYSVPSVTSPSLLGATTIGYLRDVTIEKATVADSIFNGYNLFNNTAIFTGFVGINSLTATTSVLTNATITTSTTTDAFITNLTSTNNLFTNATTTNSYISALVASSSTLTDAFLTNSTSTNAYIQNLVAASSSVTDALFTNATSTNLVATNATSTSLFAQALTAVSSFFTNLTATNATTTNLIATNATSTNLFAGTGFVTNLTTTAATSTNLFSTNAFFTNLDATNINLGNATTTNFIATNATTTRLFTQNLAVGNATTQGNQTVNGDLTVNGTTTIAGNITLGTSTATYVSFNGLINSNIIPAANKMYDLGSPSFYWRDLYADNINVNTISAASTTISGTSNNTFSINSDNATTDGEDVSLVFFRGLVTPNALLRWNATTKRLESNMSFKVQNETPITGTTTLTIQAGAGQGTTNLLEVKNIGGTNLTVIDANGRVGIGSSTPSNALTVVGDASVSGTTTLATTTITQATITNASTTNLSATGATLTNLFSSVLNAVTAGFTNVTTTNATSTNLFSSVLSAVTGTVNTLTGGSITATSSLVSNGTLNVTGQTTLGNASTTNLTVSANAYFGGNTGIWNSSGNVGIGTTNPGTRLDVRGPDSLPMYVRSDDVGSYIRFLTTNTVSRGAFGYNAQGAQFFNGALNTTNMTILDGGNVGIGTTTPGAKLTVAGSAYFPLGGNEVMTFGTNAVSHGVFNTPESFYFNIDSDNTASSNIFQIGANRIGDTGGNPYLTVVDGGNVGIGTTTPAFKLDVAGTANFTSDNGISISGSNYQNAFTIRRDGGTGQLQFVGNQGAGASGFRFITPSASQAVTILDGGNVGIGTTTPSQPLTVVGNGFFLKNLGVGATTSLYFGVDGINNSADLSIVKTASNNASDFVFSSWNGSSYTEKARILSSGNFGVGTTNPAYKLDVDGSVRNAGYLIGVDTLSGGNIRYLFANDGGNSFITNGNFGIGTTTPLSKLHVEGTTDTSIQVRSTGSNDQTIQFSRSDQASNWFMGRDNTDSTFRIQYNTSGTGVQTLSNAAYFTIDDGTGNVGIGTTNPGAKLEIQTAGATSTFFQTGQDTAGNTSVRRIAFQQVNFRNAIQGQVAAWTPGDLLLNADGGNIGIGNTAPGSLLHVGGGAATLSITPTAQIAAASGSSTLAIAASNASTNSAQLWLENLGQRNWTLEASRGQDAFNIAINNGANKLFTVLAGGNVGIGTTNPGSLLQVGNFNTAANTLVTIDSAAANQAGFNIRSAGTNVAQIYRPANSTDLRIYGQTLGADIITLNTTSGNIGIGTTSPSTQLHLASAAPNAGGLLIESTSGSSGGIANIELRGRRDDTNGSTPFGGSLYLSRIYTPGNMVAGVNDTFSQLGNILFGGNAGGTTAASIVYPASIGGIVEGTFTSSTSASTGLVFRTGSTGQAKDAVNTQFGTERMRITNAGNVGIGTTTPTQRLEVQQGNIRINSADQTLARLQINNTGISGREYALVSGIPNVGQTGFTLYDVTANASRMVVDAVGNVGIGTTNPISPLQINGNLTVGSGVASSSVGSIQLLAGGVSPISNRLTYGTDGTGWKFAISKNQSGVISDQFVIQDNGNIGVGTSSASSLLSLQSTNPVIQLTDSDTGTSGFLDWQAGTSLKLHAGSDRLDFIAGNAERMRITNAGNVGIGTTTPGKTLDVIGQIRVAASAGSGYALIEAGQSGTATNNWHFGAEGNGYFNFYNGNLGAGTNRMTISSSGNVGIGTTTPGSRLTVAGDALLYAANPILTLASPNSSWVLQNVNGAQFRISEAGTSERFTIASGGNIGIGTSTPDDILTINKTTGDAMLKFVDAGSPRSYFGFTNNTGGVLPGTVDNDTVLRSQTNLAIGTGGYFTRLFLASGGNIGIGTTTPESAFQINATSSQIIFTPSGSGTETTDNIGFEIRSNNYANGPYASRFVKADEGGGIPLYIQNNESGDANTWINNARFGSYTGNNNKFETFGQTSFATGGGNVGIGTTTPSAKLTVSPYQGGIGTLVNGATAFIVGESTTLGSATGSYLYPQELQSNAGNVLRLQTAVYRRVAGSSWNGTGYRIQYGVDQSFTDGSKAYIEVGAGDPSVVGGGFLAFGTAGSDRLTINNAGNVGIGTTGPAAKLDVAGNINLSSANPTIGNLIGDNSTVLNLVSGASSNTRSGVAIRDSWNGSNNNAGYVALYVGNGSGNTEGLRVINGGNVGIGTVSPNTRFEVAGASGASSGSIRNNYSSSFTDRFIEMYHSGDTTGAMINTGGTTAASQSLNFQNGGVTGMTLRAGNLGVGTTTPDSKLTVSGTTTLVGSAAGPTALRVIGNIDNTASGNIPPRLVSSVGTFRPTAIFASGNYLYVTNKFNNTLSVIDATNIQSPTTISTVVVGLNPVAVVVSGRYAYVTNRDSNTMSVVDISNPAALSVVATVFTGTSPNTVYVSGKYAYVTNSGTNTVSIFDIANPSAPTTASTPTVGNNPNSIYVSGKYAYVANYGSNSLSIIDVSNPSSPTTMSTPATGTGPQSVYVSGKYAYVANYGSNSLSIIDVSNPSSPSTVSTPSTGGSLPNAVRVSGRYAYVTNNNDSVLSVLDVSNPSSVVVSTSVIPSSPGLLGLYISGRYAYLAEYNLSSVSIYDIGGLETNGAIIASLEAGNAQIRNDLTVQGGIFTQALNAVSAYIENLSARVLSLSSLALGAASNVATNALLSLNLATSGTELVTKNTTAAFSVAGSTATVGVSTSSNMISLSLASTTSIGNGTMTAGPSLATGTLDDGGHAILRPDGKYLIINGNATTATNIYDPVANTFVAGPTLSSGSVQHGGHSIQRPDGKFLVINANNTAATNIYDPIANTFTTGPSFSTGVANFGSHSILRPDGKYLVINASISATTNIYDPVANSFAAGPSLATSTAYAGSHSIQRPDGKFLVINGNQTNATNIYDPVANTFVAGPTLASGTAFTGSHSIQRPDGRFLVINANNTTTTNIYDPVANTFVVGPSLSNAPNHGSHSIQRPDGKWLVVIAGTSSATEIYDPITNTFSAGPTLASGSAFNGSFSLQRPDGKYLIVNGNVSATTNIYDPSYVMSGVYESEDMLMTDLNQSSVLNFTTNGEGKIEVAIKTATSTAALAASYTTYATTTSGSKIFPVSGAQYAKVRVTLSRSIPTDRQPYVGSKESGTWLGESDAKYQRSFANPILYSFSINNQKGYHVTNTDFGTNSASTTLTSNATSGPIVSSLMTGDGGLTLPYTTGIPGNSTITDERGSITPGPNLTATVFSGASAIHRPDGRILIIHGQNQNTTTIFDPVTSTSTAGPTLTTNVYYGSHSFQRPDGKFVIFLGNLTTTTNIYDPAANTFTAGPTLAAGTIYNGAHTFQLPNGKFLTINGNNTQTTNIYDPVTNTFTQGPNLSANAGVGSFTIKRPDGKFLTVMGNDITSTSVYDPTANVFYAGPTLNPGNPGVGNGAMALQRPDGKFLIIHGASGSSADIYDPISNSFATGPNNITYAVGSSIMQRPDGKFTLIPGATTNTRIYDPYQNNIGITGVTLPALTSNGGFSIPLPNGKFLIINGNTTNVTAIYDPGWNTRGYYESEFINDTTLDSNSVLVWKGNADAYKSGVVSMRVRTATSTNALQTASWRTLPVSGSRINPSAGEVWMQVRIEMNRSMTQAQPGALKNVSVSESGNVVYNRLPLLGSAGYTNQAQVLVAPTIYSYAIQKQEGQDLATFQVNGNSVFRFSATGDAYTSAGGSWNAGGADVAEYFPTEDSLLEPGDIVSVSQDTKGLVSMTTDSYDDRILGIVTTAPGLRLGSDDIGANQGKQPIALAGRVPVKVSLENGVIKKGDYLTSSSRPGFAMKALDAGRVIGIALEDYTLEMDTQNNGAGKVLTFVNPHFYMGATFTEKVTSTFSRFATMIQKGVAELGVTITDAGNIGVGTTNPLSRFHVAGDVRLGVASTTSGALIFQNEANGYATTLRSATSTLTGDLTLTLPDSLGKTTQALMTDGAGYTYWGTVARVNDTDIKEGYLPRFLNDGSLVTGSFLDDGVVTGINATSTDTTFTVKSTASTTYAFSVFSRDNNPLFTIGNDGAFSFGTDVVVASGGDIFTKGTLATEAEGVSSMYTAVEALDIGTVVAFADIDTVGTSTQATSTESSLGVQKATSTLDAIGVVTSRSGITLGTSTVNGVPVAFAGRVPVKVTTENGEVKRGDYLTVSKTIPGYAMKLTGEGKAIGRALSGYTQGNDKVMMLVENGYQKLNLLGTTASTTGMLTTGNVDLNANGVAIYNIKSLASANGTWSIDEHGRIVGKTLCIEDVCIDKATLTNILQATGQISVAAPSSPVTGTSTGETGGDVEGETNQTNTGTSTEPGLSEGSQSEDLEHQPEVPAENQGAGEDDAPTEVATPSSPEPVEVVPVVQTGVTPPAAPEAPVTQTDAASGEPVL